MHLKSRRTKFYGENEDGDPPGKCVNLKKPQLPSIGKPSVPSENYTNGRSPKIKLLPQQLCEELFVGWGQRNSRMREKDKSRWKNPFLSHVFNLHPSFLSRKRRAVRVDPDEKIIELGCSHSFFPVGINLLSQIKNFNHSFSR